MKRFERRRAMLALGVVATVLTFLVCAGCDYTNSKLLPKELEGVWTTDDARYRDRFLELSQAFVIVVTGPEDRPSVQLVDKVETQTTGTDTALTVYSTDYSQGLHHQMALTFSPANGGEIRFKNQTQVWRRRGDEAK